MTKKQKLSCKSSFQLTEITKGCLMPRNKEEVLIYTALDGDTEALCERAIYLVAGTVLHCGIDMSSLNGETPEEKLCETIKGHGEIDSIAMRTGFYSYYLDSQDIKRYQYLRPDYVLAWARVPQIAIESVEKQDDSERTIPVTDLDDDTLQYDCISKSQIAYDIGKAFKKQRTSVADVRLDIFYHPAKGYIQEYVVVTYNGGAIATRNNNMNSVTATYDSIGELLNGGYYDEVKDYQNIAANPEWVKVDVSKYLK